jgi:predicted DNA binding CopG/RHH family protein
MTKLDREESEILEAFESEKLKQSKNAEGIREKHKEYAAVMLRKDARINIRISSRDLRSLQKRAIAEGMPYQTLVASVLHKYVEGRLHESNG